MSQMVIREVVAQHAEEAAFLWLLRNNAVHAPHYSLKDLAKLDDRVEAHLDGLRIAGEAGWEICKEALGQQEPGEVFAAAVLAFESGDENRIKEVLAVGSALQDLSRGIVSALGWIPFPQVQAYLQRLVRSELPSLRRIGIAGFAVHRQDPAPALKSALADPDPLLKARALKAVGELGYQDLLPAVQSHMGAEDERICFAAAWTGALLGDPVAVSVLRALAERGRPDSGKACAMALRCMTLPDAHRWQRQLTGRPETQRLAIIGAGVIGDPALILWLNEQMAVPDLARVAGEAFTMITGADIAYEDLEGNKPEGFEPGPTENPEDENVEMDQDEDLPWPNPRLVEKWWAKRKGDFRDGVRHLLGRPISPDWSQQVLKIWCQRHRAAAALELAIQQPGQPLFEVRAPGFRQQPLLK